MLLSLPNILVYFFSSVDLDLFDNSAGFEVLMTVLMEIPVNFAVMLCKNGV
jgi:hypothetical protein